MTAINQSASLKLISNPWLRIIRPIWLISALLFISVFIASLPGYLNNLPQGVHGSVLLADPANIIIGINLASAIISISAALISFGLSWVLFHQKPNERMAVFISFYLLLFGIITGPLGALYSLYPSSDQIILMIMEGILYGPLSIALLILFPNGRFVPDWSRWILLASVLLIPLNLIIDHLISVNISNMYAWLIVGIGFVIMIAAFYTQIIRYRKVSTMPERQQSKWFIFGIAIWLIFMIISTIPYFEIQNLPPGAEIPWWAISSKLIWFSSTTIIPISLSIAVWKYHLYDIDILINRTLVYSALTASVIILYSLVVVGFGLIFQTSGNQVISLIATGLVAVVIQPVREKLQQAVNRMMFGNRDEPYEVLRSLGQRLEATVSSDSVIPTIVETVANTLKVPYVEILIKHNERFDTAAIYGESLGQFDKYPIQYQSETIGYLNISPRNPGELFSAADGRLLRQIARQAGPALHAVGLTNELQSSRVRLVTTREEERRRMRRDLHDGLGPVLASQGLKMAAASQLIQKDPAKAQSLLEDLAVQTETAVSEIRKLVYDLRPAVLDNLGLIGAVRDYAMEINQNLENTDTFVDVIEPGDGLPELTAAIEVAAYRIVTEALTNVSRHSQANKCKVSFNVISNMGNKTLRLEVADNGEGFEDNKKAGLGLTSMKERAEELGGSIQILSKPEQGTRVIVLLPIGNH